MFLNQTVKQLTQTHALTPYWEVLFSTLQAKALQLALEKNLFTQLSQAHTAAMIAEKLQLQPQNCAYFLNLLCALKLLDIEVHQQQNYYVCSKIAAQYLNADQHDYCGDALLFRYQTIQRVSDNLTACLDPSFNLTPSNHSNIAVAWANAAQKQIAQEQTAVTQHIAQYLTAFVPEFKTASKLLDVGAGAGRVSVQFAQSFPALNCTLLEFPEVIAAIQPALEQYDCASQLQFCSGNIETLEITQDYDIIWCSSVLHFVQDYPAVLSKLSNALKPNGVLICAHSERDIAQPHLRIQSHYFNMLTQGHFVPEKGQIAQALKSLGFHQIQQIENVEFPVAPLDVIIARKPA